MTQIQQQPGKVELLPCPFCGGDELSHGYSSPGVDGSMSTGEVQCHACDVLLWRPTEREAIAAWNTRSDPKLLAQRDELVAALKEARLAVAADLEDADDPDGRYHSFHHVFAERLAKIDRSLANARQGEEG